MMRTVAEAMIGANSAVAKRISEAFPTAALLRRHPPPRIEAFAEVKECCRITGSLTQENMMHAQDDLGRVRGCAQAALITDPARRLPSLDGLGGSSFVTLAVADSSLRTLLLAGTTSRSMTAGPTRQRHVTQLVSQLLRYLTITPAMRRRVCRYCIACATRLMCLPFRSHNTELGPLK